MVFSLKLPKLSGGLVETPKIIPEILKVPEILEISHKREMLTLFRDFRDFCGVSGSISNLTVSFWIERFWNNFGT
jgi:hypothetical protein